MTLHRTLAVITHIFRGVLVNKISLMFLFISPMSGVLIFGLAFKGDVTHVQVAVVSHNEGYVIPPSKVRVSISSAIIANLDPEVVDVKEVATEAEGVRLVESGDAYAVIVFPKDFTYNVYQKGLDPEANKSLDTEIRLKRDRTNVNVAAAVQRALGNALVRASASMGVEGTATVDSSDDIYGKNARLRDFLLPGIASLILFINTFILTITSFVAQRTSGCLARMRVTPLRPAEFVMGYAIAFTLIGLGQSITLLTCSVYGFRLQCVGSLALAFLVFALLSVMSLSLGLLLSSLATRSEQAMQFLPMVALPSFLLSGIFWPVEANPTWLRPLSWAVPTTYAIISARDVMLRGWGIGQIWLYLVVLAIFTVVFLALSVVFLSRSKS
jgi:ABC-2 type transport system permease protein